MNVCFILSVKVYILEYHSSTPCPCFTASRLNYYSYSTELNYYTLTF
jgi:hypothetical protein